MTPDAPRRGLRDLADRAGAHAHAVWRWALRAPAFALTVRLLRGTIGDFLKHDALVYAAAVAFYASVSLFPLLLLIVSVAGLMLAGGPTSSGAAPEALIADVLVFLRAAVPYLSDDMKEIIAALIAQRAQLGIAGIVGLVMLSSMVFRSLEFAVARVFSWQESATVRPRNPVVARILFGAFATAATTIFVGLRSLLGALRSVAGRADPDLARLLEQLVFADGSWIRSLAWSAVVVMTFMTLLAYFGRRRVRPRPLNALIGGLLFMVLWRLTGWTFDFYIGHFASIPSTYGPWAALIVIQLWFFYSAAVFLLACELVKTLQALDGPSTSLEAA